MVFFYSKGDIEMMTIDMVATGANIKRIMKDNHVKVVEMQRIMGFNTPQAIYKWFRGDAMPTIDNMVIMASVCGVKIDDIIITTAA
jgi:hypothetical protein